MNLIKHVFKKHLPSALLILFGFLVVSAVLPINAPSTLVFEDSAMVAIEEKPSLLVAQAPEDISKNPILFDIEIRPTSPKPHKGEIPLIVVVIAGLLMVVIVAYVVDIFYRRRRIK